MEIDSSTVFNAADGGTIPKGRVNHVTGLVLFVAGNRKSAEHNPDQVDCSVIFSTEQPVAISAMCKYL